ncbi:hypothetical protein HK104_004289, partial [Borealophlyctis nickersoniae]
MDSKPTSKPETPPSQSTWTLEDADPSTDDTRSIPPASKAASLGGQLYPVENDNDLKKDAFADDSIPVVHHPEEHQFTFRASIIGSLLGCIVAASNMYLGLKVGWTFGAQLFAAIFTFGILKPLTNVMGGYFGPKE